jgi:hypothetical protein
MIKRCIFILISFFGLSFAHLYSESELSSDSHDKNDLFKELSLVRKIDLKLKERLPLIYNQSLIIGYISMPSARMSESGTLALGFSKTTPYHLYSLNFQMFNSIEMVGNYRVYKEITETGFGHLGFGDDTDRGANIKFRLYQQNQDFPYIPNLSFGFEDFYGSKRFYSFYAVATEEILPANLELSLGYGLGRIKGFYGAASWTPFRKSDYGPLKGLSLLAEYDANNYKHHKNEHPLGKEIKSRINVGVCLNLFDFLQFKVSSLRGKEIAASASIYYNIGSSKGFFPKSLNPAYYNSPVNNEPLGIRRKEYELAQELAYAFCNQGLNLYKVYLMKDKKGKESLWIKIINTIYRKEGDVRDRVEHLLSTLIPSDIFATNVVVEADGVECHAYYFRTSDLIKFKEGTIGPHELDAVSPLVEVPKVKGREADLLYKRRKDIWTLLLRPRMITFFGSTTGKIKYSAGFIGGVEGYFFDNTYYKTQVAYNISSSLYSLRAIDVYNISHLPIVRSDSVKYFQRNNLTLEQAYLQRGLNIGGGWFSRVALGYFEPAYAGVALEALYYPVNSSVAVGFEFASVLKRDYHGIGVKTKTIQINHQNIPKYIHFIGLQYFLDIYYQYKPWMLDFTIMVGQFLAKDKGARFEIAKEYKSGSKFSIWYTVTNGGDIVNFKTYYDKGIAFSIPLDFFLKKSSKSMLGYAMSAWLRDVGAQALTGKKLYETIHEERR